MPTTSSNECSDAKNQYRNESLKRRFIDSDSDNTEQNNDSRMGIGDIKPKQQYKSYDPKTAVEIARSLVNDDRWSYSKKRGIYCKGDWKCNIFVYEVLRAAGAKIPLIGGMLGWATDGKYGYPPSAYDWENENIKINGWAITKHPKPGDVVSTGEHVGIYIGNGKMISAARDKIVMTDLKSYENYTYRHYEGTLLDSILNDVINNHQSNN